MASVITFKEAKVLAEDPHSCVKIENVNRKVNLSYKYIDCAKKGIQEILDNELNLYTESLNGAMIAYRKVRLRQHMGRIVECQPFIQFNVQVDVAVFRPYPGAMMKGVINKIGNDHIGLLIHNIFNGSLRRPKDLKVKLSVGQEVWFKIWKVYQHGGLTAVRGDLDIDSMGAETVPKVATDLLPLPSANTKIPEDASDTAASSSGDSKKRKRKRTMSGTGELDTSVSTEVEEEPGFLSPASEKKRKRRKKDKGAEEVEESAHKQKKRKRSVSFSDLDGSAVSTADEGKLTRSEKKRKRHKKSNPEESNESLLGESATSEALGQSLIGSPPILSLIDHLKVESAEGLSSPSPKKKLKHKKKGKDVTELTSTPARAGPSTEVNAETPRLNETSLPGGLLNDSVDQTDSPVSSKKHKKKKKKSRDSELDTTLNDSIISVGKSDVFAGSDSGISDSTPQSLTDSAKKIKKKKKSKGNTSVAIASPSNATDS